MDHFSPIAEVIAPPSSVWIYEHGWQSWSPTAVYRGDATSARARRPQWQTLGYRPGKVPPDTGFQAEGLLAVAAPGHPVRLWYAPDPWQQVASVRAQAAGDRLLITADGPVSEYVADSEDLGGALAAWAPTLPRRAGLESVGSLPPGWCSWYCYWGDVHEEHVLANLEAIDRLQLDVATVQIDDGHQGDIGDWLERSPNFAALDDLSDRIGQTGRQAGIWTAPFLVGARSRLATAHPDWLVRGAVAAPDQWDQQVLVLDVTHPDAAEHLAGVYRTLLAEGFTYHKLDFLYAGAMEGGRHADVSGLQAYAEGLRIIRQSLGLPATIATAASGDVTMLGCGAPLLPSIGRFDAMRIGPDIDPRYEPLDGDISQPSQRSAVAAGRARGWMHARWWVNDPDCVIVRPQVERRQDWATYLQAYSALAVSSDPLDELDGEGLALTRRLLRSSSTDPLDWPLGPPAER